VRVQAEFCLLGAIPGMRSVHNVERNVRVSGQEPLAPDVLELLKRHAWEKIFTAKTGGVRKCQAPGKDTFSARFSSELKTAVETRRRSSDS